MQSHRFKKKKITGHNSVIAQSLKSYSTEKTTFFERIRQTENVLVA
jgi:hypothetical protein